DQYTIDADSRYKVCHCLQRIAESEFGGQATQLPNSVGSIRRVTKNRIRELSSLSPEPYSRSRRVSASPKRSSFTPILSMIERYRLHIFRFSSPACRKSSVRPVCRAPPSPPANTRGNLVLSCFRPIHMFERNIRHELSSTVPLPSGMLSSLVAR